MCNGGNAYNECSRLSCIQATGRVILHIAGSYMHIIAERISARQYKSGSILGIYVRRSSAQAQALRRVRARAYTV